MTTRKTRLTEQDLARLYLQTEAPIAFDKLIDAPKDDADLQRELHDTLSSQTPDLALISLSLCGLVAARGLPGQVEHTLLTELAINAEDNLLTVGRLWLDHACYGIAPDAAHDGPILLSIPERLRILTSIYIEMRDGVTQTTPVRQALSALYYQAESHSDLADIFIEQMLGTEKKHKAKTPVLDQIPLPLELQPRHEAGKVVQFSLFRETRKR